MAPQNVAFRCIRSRECAQRATFKATSIFMTAGAFLVEKCPRHEVNMKSTPVRFTRGRFGGVAGSLAMLVFGMAACAGVGEINGAGPGTATGNAGTGVG